MNDGKQPTPRRRSPLAYIVTYGLMAGVIGLFVWMIVSRFTNSSNVWTESQLDSYLGLKYEKNTATDAYEVKGLSYAEYEAARVTDKNISIQNATVSRGYKSVEISGKFMMYDKASAVTRYGNYYVRVDEATWSNSFTVIMPDGSSVDHLSWYTAFETRINQGIDYAKAHDQATTVTSYYLTNNDAFQVSWWDTWGPTIISTGITILLLVFLFSRMMGASNGANSIMNFNKSPARRADNSKVRFADVAGCDEEKAEMVELVEYLKDPKKFTKFGARLPKGVLLIGPPGTGKTLLAKAVAGEAGAPFFSISGSDFVEMYVGVGAGRVRDLFAQAKAAAPCLIFIDEIDAVGRQRGAGLGGGNDEREQTLNQLLVEMDGFEPNSGILVIAATNRDDVLDPALRRAGRFDRTITVSLPDKAGREAIFKVHARNKKIDPSVDFAALAKRTVGFSGADIDNVLNEAAILAVRGNKESIGVSEIDEAIDRRISGPAKSSKGLSEQERKQVAYHEAGHAVIGINLPHSDKVQKITIVPRGNTGGHVLMTPEDDRFLLTKSELIARITGLLGGRTSEEIFFEDVSTGASNDIQEATRLARLMVTEFGMSDLGPIQYERDTGSVFLGRDYASTQKNFSTQVAYEIDKAVREIIEQAHAEARKLLEEKKDQVTLIAETLLDKETITAEEIEYLCKNGKLPEKKVEAPAEETVVAEEVKPEAEEPKPEDKPGE